jgi:hypothetical protein
MNRNNRADIGGNINARNSIQFFNICVRSQHLQDQLQNDYSADITIILILVLLLLLLLQYEQRLSL